MKKITKILLLLFVVGLIMAFPISLAFADEGEPVVTDEPTIEQTVDIDEGEIADKLSKKVLTWLTIGGGAAVIVSYLGILKPFFKTLGENKTLKAAYSSNKDKIAEILAENSTLKEFVNSTNITEIMGDIAKSVKEDLIPVVKTAITAELAKRTDISGQILANTEVMAALINKVISAASLAWNGVDGVPKVLAAPVNTALIEKTIAENEAMKTIVAQELGISTSQLQEKIDKVVSA